MREALLGQGSTGARSAVGDRPREKSNSYRPKEIRIVPELDLLPTNLTRLSHYREPSIERATATLRSRCPHPMPRQALLSAGAVSDSSRCPLDRLLVIVPRTPKGMVQCLSRLGETPGVNCNYCHGSRDDGSRRWTASTSSNRVSRPDMCEYRCLTTRGVSD